MKKITILLAIIMLAPTFIFAQVTFTNGLNSLELSGYIIGFYQYRPKYSGDPKTSDNKNIFDLDDARFTIRGYVMGHFKFELEANFADILPVAVGGLSEVKSDPLTEANVSYINPYINVKAGYFKLPFSESSYLDKVPSPFLQRTPIADGDYFARRDAGILLFKDLWHQRINITAGIISGLGEYVILGDGDKGGKPAYIAKISLSTAYYRDEEIDYNDLPVPLARVAGAAIYNNKTQWLGDTTNAYSTSDVVTINGIKTSYEMDAGFMWHGFSAQFEMDRAHMAVNPDDPEAAVLKEYSTNYFRDGGYLVQANYYNKLLRSVFAIRYDEFNPTDLINGQQERTLGFAYNFLMLPYKLTIKLHYDYRFKEPATGQKWDEDQLRAGIQWVW